MEVAGFALRVSDPDFVRRTRVMPFIHTPTGMPLDVVLAASGLEDEFLARAINVNLDDTTVPVIHIEDLIIGKILAGRPKDVEDVKNLWQLHHATVDRTRVTTVLAMLEEALGQGDLLPTFDAIANRVRT